MHVDTLKTESGFPTSNIRPVCCISRSAVKEVDKSEANTRSLHYTALHWDLNITSSHICNSHGDNAVNIRLLFDADWCLWKETPLEALSNYQWIKINAPECLIK